MFFGNMGSYSYQSIRDFIWTTSISLS